MANSIRGVFFGLPTATLQSLLTQYQAALVACATGGQSYSISGRQFTRANLGEIQTTMMELQAAIGYSTNSRQTSAFPSFTGPYSK